MPAPSAVSTGMLTHPYEAWRERALQTHWRVLYLDGVHFSIRHGEKADATIILTALGVDLEGNIEVLALRACAEERLVGIWGQASKAEALTQLAAFKAKFRQRYRGSPAQPS